MRVPLILCLFATVMLPCGGGASRTQSTKASRSTTIVTLTWEPGWGGPPPKASIMRLYESGEITVSSDALHGETAPRTYRLSEAQLAQVIAQLRKLLEGESRDFVHIDAGKDVSTHTMGIRLDQHFVVFRSTQDLARARATPSERRDRFRLVYQEQVKLDYLLWHDLKDVLQQAVITAAGNEREEE